MVMLSVIFCFSVCSGIFFTVSIRMCQSVSRSAGSPNESSTTFGRFSITCSIRSPFLSYSHFHSVSTLFTHTMCDSSCVFQYSTSSPISFSSNLYKNILSFHDVLKTLLPFGGGQLKRNSFLMSCQVALLTRALNQSSAGLLGARTSSNAHIMSLSLAVESHISSNWHNHVLGSGLAARNKKFLKEEFVIMVCCVCCWVGGWVYCICDGNIAGVLSVKSGFCVVSSPKGGVSDKSEGVSDISDVFTEDSELGSMMPAQGLWCGGKS